MLSHLNSHLGNAGMTLWGFVCYHSRYVTNCKYVIRAYYPANTIGPDPVAAFNSISIKTFGNNAHHPGTPDHVFSTDGFAALKFYFVTIITIYLHAQKHLNAHPG